MKWIGLTGGIATGKSTVAKILRELGIPVVDADVQAHESMHPSESGFAGIVQAFGQGVVGEDGQIDRRSLGEIVFSDAVRLRELEEILHPIVKEKTLEKRREFEQQGALLAFYDVPLLFEKEMEDQFDKIVVVSCSEEIQRQRLKERNGLSDAEADQRLQSQLPIEEKVSRADYVIVNEVSLAELKDEVKNLLGILSGGE